VCVRDVDELRQRVGRLSGASEPADLSVYAVDVLQLLDKIEKDVCAIRDDAIRSLHEAGESLQRIRERTGLSRTRLHQIIAASRDRAQPDRG
jgi:hypothetical protein